MATDIDDELRFHVEARVDDLVASGVPHEAATARALAELGDISEVRGQLTTIDRRTLRSRSRIERWRIAGIDIRYAIRRLWHTPGFSIAAILTMTIAIGATTSVFGLVNGVLLKGFPYRQPDRLVSLWESSSALNLPKLGVSGGDYADWLRQNRAFTGLAAAWERDFTVIGRQESEHVTGFSVSPNYFPLLGITPVLGRPLAPDSAGPPEVVIGYDLWQRRFGGARSVLGQSLTLVGENQLKDSIYSIVGVMPPGLPARDQLWTRLTLAHSWVANHRASAGLNVYGRLRPGITLAAAQAEMKAIAQRLATAYPQTNKDIAARVIPLVDQLVGDVRPALLMLLVAAACVLLIGAANLANLFLVRCLARQRELALRTALGASRSRLVRGLLAEGAILGVFAGVIAIVGAFAGVRALRSLAPTTMPRLSDVAVDGRVLEFCVAMSLATVCVFALLPALWASRDTIADVLKSGGGGTATVESHRLQDGLVVLQIAVALVLLTGASLFVESFVHLLNADPGLRPEGVLTAVITPDPERYPTPEQLHVLFSSVAERLAAQEGVDGAAVSTAPPAGSNDAECASPIPIIGDPAPDLAHLPLACPVGASPGYFRTVGIRVLRGRGILPADDMRTSKVAVIDQLLARRYFAGRDPVGRRLAFGSLTPVGRDTVEIVGVVATVKLGGLAGQDVPEIYVPMDQYPEFTAALAVRTKGDPDAFSETLKRVLANIDPTMSVYDVETMRQRMAQSLDATQFSTFLASLFAGVALLLSIIGIYSVLAYVVTQRQREIAVRITLGADRSRVMGEVVRHGLALTAVGIVVGSFLAWILTGVLARLFLGVSPHDPTTFIGVAGAFALVSVAATSGPAFRTTRINPVVALTST
jgi:putative ABC transport system permease protein